MNIAAFLEDSATRFPNKVAVEDESGSYTYGELRNRAYGLARELLMRGARREPVAVFMDRSAECVTAMMGAAYSRCFYTIIDVTMPMARAERIVQTLQPRYAVVNHQTAALAQALGIAHIIDLADVTPHEGTHELVAEAYDATMGDDLLYVLFTSGSTGVPKGVSVPHAALMNYAHQVTRIMGFDESFRIANQAPFYFDHSHLDIYVSLLVGGTLLIPPKKLFSYPVRILDYLIDHKVTCLFWVPPLMIALANFRALKKRHVPTLKTIMAGGEVLPVKQLNMWRSEYPDATFVNLYGPTETTVDCAYYIVDRDFSEDERLPIGRALPNNELIVLREDGSQVAPHEIDEPGELCVRGANVALGYYRNPEATAASFVQNPLHSAYRDIVYRTGDLVSYNVHGELEYRSRKDFQIKRMGYRIELGEIESAAGAVEGVSQCCCVFDAQRERIVLYYVGKVTPDDLRASLAQRVPSYMLPDTSKGLAALPINMNGKVDRAELLRWAVEGR